MSSRFDIKDMGPVRRFLGIRIAEQKNGVHMSQTAYVMKILELFILLGAKENTIALTSGEHMNRLAFPPEDKGDEESCFP